MCFLLPESLFRDCWGKTVFHKSPLWQGFWRWYSSIQMVEVTIKYLFLRTFKTKIWWSWIIQLSNTIYIFFLWNDNHKLKSSFIEHLLEVSHFLFVIYSGRLIWDFSCLRFDWGCKISQRNYFVTQPSKFQSEDLQERKYLKLVFRPIAQYLIRSVNGLSLKKLEEWITSGSVANFPSSSRGAFPSTQSGLEGC